LPKLGHNSFFFGVIDVEEIVNVMPDACGHKLRNIVLHEFLDRVRQLRKTFIAPIVVPFDDLDAGPLFGGLLNPTSDLFVGGSRSNEFLEVLGRDFRKSEEEVIQGTIKVVFAGGPRQSCSALIQCPGSNNVTG
jgi:hypothetical protein